MDEGEGRWTVPLGILCMLAGSILVYSALAATGLYLYGNLPSAVTLTVLVVLSALFLARTWRRVIRK